MKYILFFTFIGILFLISGIFSVYKYFESLNQNNYPWLLFLSFALFGGCAFFFFKATNHQTTNTDNKPDPMTEKTERKSILERNNELIKEYRNTSNTRDKLKVLESASKKDIL